jgi:hypothetical protein
MSWFVRLMPTPAGRVCRVVGGAVLIGTGLLIGGLPGVLLDVLGAFPLLTGLFDVCLFGPLFHLPFRGARFRATH